MIPRTLFSEEHEIFRASVRKFLEHECAPHHERWEEQGNIDREAWNKAGAQGLLCPTIPEEYGGAGTDFLYNVVIDEEITRLGLSGIGYPAWTGGVLQFINSCGLAAFVARSLELAERYGEQFAPPASLVARADRGESY